MVTPMDCRFSPIFSAISWSNPRKNMLLTMTSTSNPIPLRKPADSNEVYEPPMQRVLPGAEALLKMSSLLRQCSLQPGNESIAGRPPVATTMYLAFLFMSLPFFMRIWRECLPVMVAYPLNYMIPMFISRFLSSVLTLLTCFCTLPTIFSQLNALWRLCSSRSLSPRSQPHSRMSLRTSPNSPEVCINFLGMQPTFTQVPPKPQVVPCVEGFTKSATPTFSHPVAAYLAQAIPPEPPPITNTSKSYSSSSAIS
mmetsp:Transcript_80966/g.175013  ORF Transcript_80966/g.175013 Transcript_80966/m.175013 type:complete len:253 (+) Transcript_80966:1007-1765(+)